MAAQKIAFIIITTAAAAVLVAVTLSLSTPAPAPARRAARDPAAWEVAELIEEARRITIEAAG